jgi:hypothetical protein
MMGNLCGWKVFLVFFVWFILSCVVPHSFIFACSFLEVRRRTNGEKNVFKIGKGYIVFHGNMEGIIIFLSCLDSLVRGKYLVLFDTKDCSFQHIILFLSSLHTWLLASIGGNIRYNQKATIWGQQFLEGESIKFAMNY